MGRMVNLCGKAIQLEDVIGFAMDRRNYIFIPCFREVAQITTNKTFFGKETSTVSTHYEFYKHIPYGAVLGEKESVWPGESYAYKTAGEIVGVQFAKKAMKAAGDAVHFAVRALKIDTSINRKYRILVDGRDLKEFRLDELPARLICRDGRKMDVYKNSEMYHRLGQNITPYEEPVPVLEVQMAKNKKYIFFGNGIDVDNVEEPYQALLTAYNIIHEEKEKKKVAHKPLINLPKFNTIKIQSPIVFKKPETAESKEQVQSTNNEENNADDQQGQMNGQ